MIVMVYGALRSGTTLLRLMLDMHPELNCPGEADFLFDHLSFNADGSAVLDRAALERNRIYQSSDVRLAPGLDGVEAVRDMLRQLQKDDQECLVLMLHREIETALRIVPDARVLHMLRDPRDVARSAIGMGWAGTAYHGAIYWMRTEWEWDAMITAVPEANTEVLRYEDLINDTESELRRLMTFFGVPFDARLLEYSEHSTYAPPDSTLVEQWRRKQTPQAVGLVEGRLGPLLESRGYAPSGHPQITPGPALAARLWLQDKQAVWKTRINRYGLVDPVLVGLGKRLHMPALSVRAQQRMNRKQVAYLK